MITEGMATGDSANMNVDAALLHWFPDHAARSTSGWLRTPYLSSRLEGRGGPVIHVLMIEDDGSIAEMYRLQLEHDGYKVTVATTGELGFSTISGSAPDIVLLDLLLPDQSGFEVLASFVLSGFVLLRCRTEFIPLGRPAYRAAYALLGFSILVGVLNAVALQHASPLVTSAAAFVLISTWAIFTGEPIVRFWLSSNALPAVQRARMRFLSFGFAVLLAIPIVALMRLRSL